MNAKEIIKGKRVLIVDDEADVLEVLAELLDNCKVDTAGSFAAAKELLESNRYDLVILDIMGVRGFDLLEVAGHRDIPALMLTAHAFTPESLKASAEKDACCFVPKEKMSEIEIFVADVIEARESGKNPWEKCFLRLGRFYDRKFGGRDWREKEKAFWEKRTQTLT